NQTDTHIQIVVASRLWGVFLSLPITVLSCFVAQIWLHLETRHQHALERYVLGSSGSFQF
ncbi:hypothetical protein, partial [Vibrio navarrensis]|uniref:hypothetical protein n=1 Tax=Vibrio navarrensis TaxID=29495 RepID=UPI001EE49FB4